MTFFAPEHTTRLHAVEPFDGMSGEEALLLYLRHNPPDTCIRTPGHAGLDVWLVGFRQHVVLECRVGKRNRYVGRFHVCPTGPPRPEQDFAEVGRVGPFRIWRLKSDALPERYR